MPVVRQKFVVVKRDSNNNADSKIVEDLSDALILRQYWLTGKLPADIVTTYFPKEEMRRVMENLGKYGRDHVKTDRKEAYIFVLPEVNLTEKLNFE